MITEWILYVIYLPTTSNIPVPHRKFSSLLFFNWNLTYPGWKLYFDRRGLCPPWTGKFNFHRVEKGGWKSTIWKTHISGYHRIFPVWIHIELSYPGIWWNFMLGTTQNTPKKFVGEKERVFKISSHKPGKPGTTCWGRRKMPEQTMKQLCVQQAYNIEINRYRYQ